MSNEFLVFEEKFKGFLFKDYIEFDDSFLIRMKEACTKPQLEVFNIIFKNYLKEEIDLFKIDTYEKVCKQLKETAQSCPFKKIKQIEKLFNGNWVKNVKDHNQRKHYPYFQDNGSGLVFDGSSCCGYCSFAGLVAYFKDEKTSSFVGKTFIDIYQELAD